VRSFNWAKQNETEDKIGASEFGNKKWTRNLEKSGVLKNLNSVAEKSTQM